MPMAYCEFCRAYTPDPVKGKCPICGMKVSAGEPLVERAKQVRPYVDSTLDPIRVKPNKGKTLKFLDYRESRPYFTSVESGAGEKQYAIMDEHTLSHYLGKPVGKQGEGMTRIGNMDFTIRYTSDEDGVASLNERPVPMEYSWCPNCNEYVPSGVECVQCGREIPGNSHGLRFGVKWKGFLGDRKHFSVYDGEVSRIFDDERRPRDDYYVSISDDPNEIPRFYVLDPEGMRATLGSMPEYAENDIIQKRVGKNTIRYTTNPDLVGSLNRKAKRKGRRRS